MRRTVLRGQVAMEYLMTMAFVVLITAPLIVLYFTQTQELSEQTADASARRATAMIAQAADTVYYLGAPAKRTIVVDVPENVDAIRFEGAAVVFDVVTVTGTSEIAGWSVTNLTGDIGASAGPHRLSIVALPDGRVNITEP